jgi:hypothetical protein
VTSSVATRPAIAAKNVKTIALIAELFLEPAFLRAKAEEPTYA